MSGSSTRFYILDFGALAQRRGSILKRSEFSVQIRGALLTSYLKGQTLHSYRSRRDSISRYGSILTTTFVCAILALLAKCKRAEFKTPFLVIVGSTPTRGTDENQTIYGRMP